MFHACSCLSWRLAHWVCVSVHRLKRFSAEAIQHFQESTTRSAGCLRVWLYWNTFIHSKKRLEGLKGILGAFSSPIVHLFRGLHHHLLSHDNSQPQQDVFGGWVTDGATLQRHRSKQWSTLRTLTQVTTGRYQQILALLKLNWYHMILALVASKSRVERAEMLHRTTVWLLDTRKWILKADSLWIVTKFDDYNNFWIA